MSKSNRSTVFYSVQMYGLGTRWEACQVNKNMLVILIHIVLPLGICELCDWYSLQNWNSQQFLKTVSFGNSLPVLIGYPSEP